MTMFWIVSAIVLLAIIGIGVWFWSRRKAGAGEVELQASQGGEADHSSMTERGLPGKVIVGLVLLSLLATFGGLYLFLSQSGSTAGKGGDVAANGSPHSLGPQQISAMAERVAARLEQNPDDGPSWLILAKSYAALGRFSESAKAYARAVALLPPDAQVLADMADTMAMAQGRDLQGEPEKVVHKALQVDPQNIKALALAGTAAYERQDYKEALVYWRQVQALVPPGTTAAAGIQGSITEAEGHLAGEGKAGLPASKSTSVATAGKSVSGRVELDPSLLKAAAPTDAVFVFARAVNGPKVPLAMMRRTVADLPLEFSLDDAMAMAPNFRISQYPEVIIGARVSKSGDALAHSGDLEGFSVKVAPGAEGVRVVVNTRAQ